MRFFSSATPESSRDCPQTDTSEEREKIALRNYYAPSSRSAHLHAAIVFVSTDGCFRRGDHSRGPSLLQNAQTAVWKITQKKQLFMLEAVPTRGEKQ